MRRSMIFVLFLCLISVCVSADSIDSQQVIGQANALMESAKQSGQMFLQSKNDASRKDCKHKLEQAEKLLKKLVEKNTGCEECVQTLGSIYFLQAYFGISKNFDEAIDLLRRAHAQFPQNSTIAYTLGFAYYNSWNFAAAIPMLNTFLMMRSNDPGKVEYARTLLNSSHQYFLTQWNRQADFYNTQEARIIRMNPQTFQNELLFQVTPDWESQLGAQSFQHLRSSGQDVNDPELQMYLQQLVQRMVEKSPGPPFQYQITVLENPAVNALAMPGHIIINSGLIHFAENESELVAILGHELAHNYGHHAARRVIKAYQAQMVTNAVISAINPQSFTSQFIAGLVGQIGIGIFVNAYNRFEESEADRYGAHIAFNAGYSPTSMSSFFLRLYAANPKQPIKWLSTHPPLPNRIEDLTAYLESFPLEGEKRLNSEAFQKIKARYAPPANSLPPLP
jgi:predicted Zn-dependent protease